MKRARSIHRCSNTVLAVLIVLSSGLGPVPVAQGDPPYLRKVRDLETNDLGILNPAGLAFSLEANGFFVVEAHSTGQVRIVTMAPHKEVLGLTSLDVSNLDPINIAFDGLSNRLFLFDTGTHELVAIEAGPDGYLAPSPEAITRYQIAQLDLQTARGMAFDVTDGSLFILDSSALEIVRVELNGRGGFDGPAALEQGRVSRIDLKRAGLVDPRGLAVHPSSGHLYLLDAAEQEMHELTAAGQVVATFDLAPFKLADPQGLAFAPSADPTDDPSIIDLYIADPGLDTGQLQNAVVHAEPSAASAPPSGAEFRSYLPLITQATGGWVQKGRALGRIVELSFVAPRPLVSAASVVSATLENSTDTSLYVPPSPDPSGLAYLSDSGTLMISDGEVDETPFFALDNLFETALSGSLITVTTTISFSNEPTGVAYNPSDRHLFFTDDVLRRVFEMDPGPDELYGTSDDIITSFSTGDFGSTDPEGIAFNSWNGHLFIVDGLGAEVYEIAPGDNGIFDGVSVDDVMTHFDATALGLADPEGIEFDRNNGHLYILSGASRAIAETLTDGTLVQTIDLSSILPTSGSAAAGLAYAPSSSDPGEMHLYIVDRGVDNSYPDDSNDGMLYEISFNQAPTVTITTPANGETFAEGEVITFTGTADDVEDPDLTADLLWSSSLDGSIGTGGSFSRSDLSAGTHTVTATVTDSGGLTGTDQITLIVTAVNDPPVVEGIPDQTIVEGASFLAISLDDYVSDVDNADDEMTWTYAGNIELTVSITDRVATIGIPNADWNGSETIVFTATDPGLASDSDGAVFTVTAVNDPPVVDAGLDQTIVLPASANLDATVTDDGLPDPSTVIVTWTQFSGPGIVTFTEASAIDTTASFSISGTYVLQLTADDGELTASDQLTVTVHPENQPPLVDAGPGQIIAWPDSTLLDGTVTDDGLPAPTPTVTWTQVSGPGTVTFTTPSAEDTTAFFPDPGTYVLQLTADDGELITSDQVTIVVIEPSTPITIKVRVSSSSDDAEEQGSGTVLLTSKDLDLVYDTEGEQTVGVRFNEMLVPYGATILSAYVQFQADEKNSEAASLTVEGQDVDHASTFTHSLWNISSRTRTTASVPWSPPPWQAIGEAGPNQRTPELSSVIQEIVDRPGWSGGNSLVIIITGTGTGRRVADSYDGGPAGAPLLRVEYTLNQPPEVNAGADQTIALPSVATLNGTATDDGLPDPPGYLTFTWTQVSGPGTVTFGDVNAAATTASFSISGTYVLQLAADDGQLVAGDQLTVTVHPQNQPPVVDAGPDQTIRLPAYATLKATVTDDGWPKPPASLTFTWTQVSGPGTVTLTDANAQDTTASFSISGTYVLQLTAGDGQLATSDQLAVTVLPANQPPVVDAGPDQTVPFPDVAYLDGTVTDDGVPDSPASLTLTWTQVSGPDVVTFGDASAEDTTASFPDPGTYVFQLAADDGEYVASDQVTVVMAKPGIVFAVEVRVSSSSDDAEEQALGSVSLTSRDLEMVHDGGDDQIVGIRFSKAGVPQGATILTAYVQFQVDETPSGATSLAIHGQDVDDAPTFTSAQWDISSRTRTTTSVPWSPPPWPTVGEAGPDQRTPDLSSIVQEIADRPGWSSSSSLVIIITGTGERVAESYDGDPAGAPLLYVEYTMNQPPVVDAGPDQTIALPDSATLNATATDDRWPEPPAFLTLTWTQVSGPGTVTFANASVEDTTASFSISGTYVLQLTADDSQLIVSDQLTVTVHPQNQPPVVDAGPDQTIALPSSAILDGTVTDDGWPQPPAALTLSWIEVSGPGTVAFGDDTAADTAASFSISGTYVLQLTADDGQIAVSDRVTITVHPENQPPVVDAGPDQTIALPDSATLDGTVTDDGWPDPPAELTLAWTRVSGPGTVTFLGATQQDTAAAFTSPGTYVLQLTADDGQVVVSDWVTITVHPQNQPPVVDAGPDQTIALPDSAALDATATDDGWPQPPAGLTLTWIEVSGPGTVTFADASAEDTTASFSISGTYVLQLTAADGEIAVSDQVTITVHPENHAPVVDAGPDQVISLPNDAYLDGTVSDDGWPDPPAVLIITWTQVSGPDLVTFVDASAEDTTVSFPDPGVYVLQLTADDGQIAISDQVRIVVTKPGAVFTAEVRVSSSSDDAEERTEGTVLLASLDLELVHDLTDQTVGIRFNEVTVPHRARILDAYVQFQADASTAAATALTVEGQDVDDAPTFASAQWDISSRTRTTASVPWSPPPWPTVGEAGPDQRTPDLSSIIQETVDRPGWSDGNSLAIIITGTGQRVAVSYDGDPAGAPLLYVRYTMNQPPVVDAGPDQTIALPSSATLNATAADDGWPDPPASLAFTWTKVSGPGTVTFADASAEDTTASFSVSGTYVLQIAADDGQFAVSDQLTVTVHPVNQPPVVDAGPNQTIALPANATLDGTVTDDGWPQPPAALTLAWTRVSGPGTVTFADASAEDTTASFSIAGTYVLQLTADDGQLSVSDQVAITVHPENQPPVVDAGPDQTVALPSSATLDGTVTDDGWPDPPASLTLAWVQVSGPATATLGDAHSEDTTAILPSSGTYVFQLTADDGALATSDQVTITATAPTVEVRVSSSWDDAEEQPSGAVRNNADLELVRDATNQVVGIRFNEVGIPYGATILSAYVQFQADESTSEATSLTVEGEDIDRAPSFTDSAWDISSRARTTASVPWSPPPWPTKGEAGPDQRTPDLSSVIQEIVDRIGWSDGNSLVIIITGTGKRVAVSYDGDPAGAPLLHVEYVLEPGHKEKSRIFLPWVSKNGSPAGSSLGVVPVQESTLSVRADPTDISGQQTTDYHHRASR